MKGKIIWKRRNFAAVMSIIKEVETTALHQLSVRFLRLKNRPCIKSLPLICRRKGSSDEMDAIWNIFLKCFQKKNHGINIKFDIWEKLSIFHYYFPLYTTIHVIIVQIWKCNAAPKTFNNLLSIFRFWITLKSH